MVFPIQIMLLQTQDVRNQDGSKKGHTEFRKNSGKMSGEKKAKKKGKGAGYNVRKENLIKLSQEKM